MARTVARTGHVERVWKLFRQFPVVGLLGARQVGKTTLARQVTQAFKSVHGFDLEDSRDLGRLSDPTFALEGLRGLVVLDEIQRRPDLFPVLRVLADRPGKLARFLVLGSASPGLLRQSSETLAGRIAYHVLPGFSLDEVGAAESKRLWLRGGFPDSYLAGSNQASMVWRRSFITTFLERDIPQLGIRIESSQLRRFWSMLAHYHGQVWNASEFSRSLGISVPTVKHYLDVLESTFAVKVLQPWHENLAKRQVKAPKVYLADAGILHALLNLPSLADLDGHPKVGASWEGFALTEVTRRLGTTGEECSFWATHQGAELDLLVVRGRRRYGFEFKRTSSPSITRSMRTAIEDLGLTRLDVVHAGEETFSLSRKIRAVALSRVLEDLGPLH